MRSQPPTSHARSTQAPDTPRELRAARGLGLGVALGLALWIVIGVGWHLLTG